jgi:hypothetical protein
MSAETINITPRRLEDAPRPVANEAGWNWPLLMGAARGIGAALFVWAVVWVAYWLAEGYQAQVARENVPTLAVIAAVGAGVFAAFRGRPVRPA